MPGLGSASWNTACPLIMTPTTSKKAMTWKFCIADRETTGDNQHDNLSARIVYKGYISLIERAVSGTSESVTVHLLGYYTRLALDVLKNSAQTTLYSHNTTGLTTTSGSMAAADIGLMVRAVIDRYRAETTDPKIFYVGTTDIPNTGTTATYAFEQKTYREALDKLKDMAPADVYWYVNEAGRLTFKAIPSTPTHTFIFGKHFSALIMASATPFCFCAIRRCLTVERTRPSRISVLF